MQIPDEQKAWVSDELGLLRNAISPPKTIWQRVLTWLFDKMLPLLVSVTIAFSGYYFTKQEDRRNDIQSARRAELNIDLQNQIMVYNEVASTITEVRAVFESIIIACRHKLIKERSSPITKEEQQHRNAARFAVIKAGFKTKFIFPKEVIEEIHDFAEFDYKQKELCSKNQQLDQEYTNREIKILGLITGVRLKFS